MSTFIISQADTRPLIRFASAIFGAMSITFLLFVLMQTLTMQEGKTVATPAPIPEINLVFEEQEITNPIKKTLPQKPKRQPRPKVLEPIEPTAATPNVNEVTGQYSPPITETTKVSLGILGSSDGDVRPIVRTAPRYPAIAAQNGTEGWVKLSFSIEKDGSVSNVTVIDAQPRSIFNREAKRALAKWKYKPQVVNGESVTRHGMQVMLEFNLNES